MGLRIRRAAWGADHGDDPPLGAGSGGGQPLQPATSDRAALKAIRLAVFVREQGIPQELEWDQADAQAIHLLALAEPEGTPVGTARLLPSGQIGRMAVLPEWRGRGVGTALLRGLLTIARQGDHPRPFLNAQVSALHFYLRAGFHPVGEVFEEAGIPHLRMELHPTPTSDARP